MFDINTTSAIDLTVKLGKLHKSALPVAVRSVLNDAAFETKRWIPIIASRKFTTRNKSFFRAFSSVNRARGFNINSFSAEVGINSLKGSRVAEGLVKQEKGGTINGRKLIAHDKARTSNSYAKRVRKKNHLDKLNIVDSKKRKGKKNINYLLIKKGGKGTVFEIKKSGKKSKLTPIYTYRNTKKSRVKASPFMAPSTFIARKKMPENYKKQAERQIKRLLL